MRAYGVLNSLLRNLKSLFIKIISLYNPINFFAILYPTSLVNLVVEVGIVSRSYCHLTVGYITLAATTGSTILLPYLEVKSLKLVWISGTNRFYVWVANLQISYRDLTTWLGASIVAPAMAARLHALIWHGFETWSRWEKLGLKFDPVSLCTIKNEK